MTIKEKQNRIKAIGELLTNKINSRDELMAIKRKLSKKYGLALLANSEILHEYKNRLDRGVINRLPILEKTLRKRTVRTMSGIAPVAVLTKAYPCPGQCVYCPKEKNVPQSYLSNEPAVMRAIRCKFDPYKQVQLRLEALVANGHEPTKIELIVIGGTWSVLPEKYKYWYIKECFRAANEFGSVILEPKAIESHGYRSDNKMRCYRSSASWRIRSSMTELKKQLLLEQRKNESAKYKIIGITLETRPDYINEKELWEMRELGATRVEIGVQAIDDKILKLNKRGHGVSEIVQATKLLKDFGFKVTYHIMPGLPGSTAKKDLAMFKQLFTDSRFQPDQIKFYPTVVTRGSLLYKWWKNGKYKPYSDKVLQELIVKCKKAVPPYVRIIRLIRDIPGESIIAGNRITNLRQIMKDRGVVCRCIRCREAGERELGIRNYELRIIKYQASGGVEYFLSYEFKDGKVLYGFCRLRLAENNLMGAAIIRELHVYGELVSVPSASSGQVAKIKKTQHSGLGKRLMTEAEKIARKNGYKKIAVISGIGVRGYYRKLGYKLVGSYMVKNLL
ncbi:MAG: tRNA uridine(34) 5-carboxymethylaminomethyl modification radical SAM/GNAT enzyme Elp3 [bacterium]|nr:tRNA uridine(34) 5-carboxymethylaminomethyl modification radical SAM/GNAT enzyme Elp3 [bacterium]